MGSKKTISLIRKQKRKQKQLVIGISVSVFVVAIIVALVITLQLTAVKIVKISPDQDGYLRISKDNLRNGLNYIDYGGTEELLVWRDSAGVYRTAFDTCEDCYPGGKVRFTLSKETITCNLCSSKQSVSVLGTEEWGGCKPVSVTPDMRDDTDTEVVLSADVQAYAEDMFSHWNIYDFGVSFSTYGTDEARTHAE